jgi:hypothetical protein
MAIAPRPEVGTETMSSAPIPATKADRATEKWAASEV